LPSIGLAHGALVEGPPESESEATLELGEDLPGSPQHVADTYTDRQVEDSARGPGYSPFAGGSAPWGDLPVTGRIRAGNPESQEGPTAPGTRQKRRTHLRPKPGLRYFASRKAGQRRNVLRYVGADPHHWDEGDVRVQLGRWPERGGGDGGIAARRYAIYPTQLEAGVPMHLRPGLPRLGKNPENEGGDDGDGKPTRHPNSVSCELR
jgi:hypothetical protein